MNDTQDNLLGVMQTLYRWRKTIRNISIFTGLGAALICFLLPNYYKSSTIFYPASPQLANPELLFGYTGSVTEYYGSDRDLDRLLELADSRELVDYMVNKYRLYEHYDIDSTKSNGPYKVRERFKKLYTIEKNKNDAIEISIEDVDRELAATMVNDARGFINKSAQNLIKFSQERILAAFDDNLTRKQAELNKLEDSLKIVKNRYSIYDVGAQGAQLTSMIATAQGEIARNSARLEVLEKDPSIPRDTIAYIRANLKGYQRQMSSVMQSGDSDNLNMKKYTDGMAVVSTIQDLHYQARKQLSYDLERYNQVRAAYNTDIQALHVVEAGEVPLRKSRPTRSLIILASMVAAFIFSCIGVLISESYKGFKWKQVFDGE